MLPVRAERGYPREKVVVGMAHVGITRGMVHSHGRGTPFPKSRLITSRTAPHLQTILRFVPAGFTLPFFGLVVLQRAVESDAFLRRDTQES